MTKTLLVSVLSTLAITAFLPSGVYACGGENHDVHSSASATDSLLIPEAHADTTPSNGMQMTRIKVAGLHCSSCERKINANLRGLKGVQSIAWNKRKNIVEVTYAKGSITPDTLVNAVNSVGDEFKAVVLE